jgi:hypothetical protein
MKKYKLQRLTKDPFNMTLSLDSIILYHKIHEKHINDNCEKHIGYIKENPICNQLYCRIYKQLYGPLGICNQSGGTSEALVLGIPVISSSIASMSIMSTVACLLYLYFSQGSVCKDSYPLVNKKRVPSAIDVILKFLPSSYKKNLTGGDVIDNLNIIKFNLETILSYFDFISSKTTAQAVRTGIIRAVTSVGAAVASMGAGGDTVISMIFTIKSAIEVMIQIAIEFIDLALDPASMRLLYDLFNVNFRDGPAGVKCWVLYIKDAYGATSKAYGIICDMFDRLMNKLAEFVGNLLSSMIPDSLGLGAYVVPFIMSNYREGALDYMEDKLNGYYDEIPYELQTMIQDPHAFKEYIVEIFNTATYVIPGFDSISEKVGKYAEMFALIIHKLFALVYSLIHIFMSCGHIKNNTNQ